jgi:large subunit ribosomal protein L4
MDAPSTRQLRELLTLLDVADQKVLLVTAENEPEIYLSSRNIPKISVQEARSLNTIDILDADVVVIQEGALTYLTDLLGAEKQPA